MTAAWSKGKHRPCAYYKCETRGCEAKSKSVPCAKIEAGLAEILQGLQPANGFFELAKSMLRDACSICLLFAHQERDALQTQLHDVAGQIEGLFDRIVKASNASVVQAYRAWIDNLERQKIVLPKCLNNTIRPKRRLQECIELALGFLANPWDLYKNRDHAMCQTVLR